MAKKSFEKIKDLDDICINYKIAREQRKNELYNGYGLKGTEGYEKMGCYECDGYHTTCNAYISKNILGGS